MGDADSDPRFLFQRLKTAVPG